MCGANPNLLPEVNSAITTSYVALAFACTTFIAMAIWPLGTASGLVGVFGVVGGSILCCCGPPYRSGQMQAAAALFFVGGAAHLLQLSFLITAFVLWFPQCNRDRDHNCGWHGFTLFLMVWPAIFALAALIAESFAAYLCFVAKRALLRVGSDPPSGERTSTQWREDLQHRGPTVAVAEATVVADCAPVQTVVGIPQGIPALAA